MWEAQINSITLSRCYLHNKFGSGRSYNQKNTGVKVQSWKLKKH